MIVGTAGHVNHGKSALVRALTGTDPDRLKEEKERGITIDLGFAYWKQDDGSVIGFIDVPGHERFVHTMLAGAHGIDVVLLVVAADDSIMPQTREHLAIVQTLGLTQAVVALTKADLADAARRSAVTADIAALLARTPFAGADILPVSTVSGEGLDALAARLRAEQPRDRPGSLRFRLSVDRCFSLSGVGTVVTGTVLSGRVAVGDQVLVSPSGLPARVRSLYRQNTVSEYAAAGDRCALNLAGPGINRSAIGRGDMVLDPVLHAPSQRIDGRIAVLATEKRGLSNWMPVRVHHAAADVAGRIVPLTGDRLAPGAGGVVQLVLETPIAALAGDRFVLRDTGGSRTLGGGVFLDLRPPARRRRTPERLAVLAALDTADRTQALRALTTRPPYAVDTALFLRDCGFDAPAGEAVLRAACIVPLPDEAASWAIDPAIRTALHQAVLAAVDAHHAANPNQPGIAVTALRAAVEPRLLPRPFRAALADMQRAGDLVADGPWVHRPSHTARLLPADEALWNALLPRLAGEERFRPLAVRDAAALLRIDERAARRLLKLVAGRGDIREVDRDCFLSRRALAEMSRIVQNLSDPPGTLFTAADFRDRLCKDGPAVGRRAAIQVLEFLDRLGITVRRGDARFVDRRRAATFGR